MNLHSIVASAIGAINPNQPVGIQISVGNATNADGTATPAYATPGLIDASIGASVTGSIAAGSGVLTVTAVLWGTLSPGDALSASDGTNAIPAGTTIASQLSGSIGGTGTYQLGGTGALSGTLTIALNPTTVISASTVLSVAAVAQGLVQAGETLTDVGGFLAPGTIITGPPPALDVPAAGGPGLYAVSPQQTVFPEAMQLSMTLLAQVQALTGGDLRHIDALNLQGTMLVLYISSNIAGAVRVALKGGDPITMPNGSVWLISQVLEPFFDTAGWQKCVMTLQNGA